MGIMQSYLGEMRLGNTVLAWLNESSSLPVPVSASVNGTVWTFTAALGVGGVAPMMGGLNGVSVSGFSVTLSNPVWNGLVLTFTGSVPVPNGTTAITLNYNSLTSGANIEDSNNNDMASFSNLPISIYSVSGSSGGGRCGPYPDKWTRKWGQIYQPNNQPPRQWKLTPKPNPVRIVVKGFT
jgi:hypothetical protein